MSFISTIVAIVIYNIDCALDRETNQQEKRDNKEFKFVEFLREFK